MPDDTRLPVVVVAGLHEAERRQAVLELLSSGGNAVVLHHDLTDAAHGRVRRDILDAAGSRSESDVPLTEGCPCCALREDLLPELLRIADAGRHRLAVVELWGGSDPHPAVEVIAEGEVDGRQVSEAVTVTGVVTALDPLRLIPQLSVPDTLSEHAARDRVNPALARLPYPQDEAGVTTLLWESRRPLHPARFHEALDQLVPAAQRSRGRFWIVELLDSCLLTDEELAAGEDSWKQLPDAFDDMLDPVA